MSRDPYSKTSLRRGRSAFAASPVPHHRTGEVGPAEEQFLLGAVKNTVPRQERMRTRGVTGKARD